MRVLARENRSKKVEEVAEAQKIRAVKVEKDGRKTEESWRNRPIRVQMREAGAGFRPESVGGDQGLERLVAIRPRSAG